MNESVPAAAPARPRWTGRVVGIVALLTLGGGGYLFLHRSIESTDDAQIDGELIGVVARMNGVVTKVNFEDNERVDEGRVLVEFEAVPARVKLAQAHAELDGAIAAAMAADADARLATTNAKATNRAATASLSAAAAGATASRDQIAEARARLNAAETAAAQAKADFDRVQRLVQSGALSQAQLEEATTARDTAQANVAQARASLSSLEASSAQATSRVGEASAKVDQTSDVDTFITIAQARARGAHAKVAELEAARDLAAIELSYTKLLAPRAGVVSKKNVSVGQAVALGSPVAQLSPTGSVWVTANFKETQVGKMRVGQPAKITVDAISGQTLQGKVESLSAATGSRFALLPPDNATGNFTKVVQRIPVRIRLEGAPESLVLRPGMSVELSVDTKK